MVTTVRTVARGDGEVTKNRILSGGKRLKKSLALFLSLVFILELILQVVPVQKVFAINYSAIGNNYYEGGYDSYTGYDRVAQKEVTVYRYDIERDMGFKPFIRIGNSYYDLNVELAVDYRKAVYGLPTDVTGPKDDPQEWKESSVGYWFIDSSGKIVPVKDISNPPAGTKRVVFKYMGYDPDGKPARDPYWPDESIEDLSWNDLSANTILPVSDSRVKSSYAQLLEQNTLAGLEDSRTLDAIFTEIINGTIMRPDGTIVGKLRNYSTSRTINSKYSYELISKLGGKVNKWNYKNYIVLHGSTKELYATAYFFFLKNGKVYAVGFSGAIGKFLPRQYEDAPELSDVQTTASTVKEVKGITQNGDEVNLPVVNGKYWVDTSIVQKIRVTFTLHGKFYDAAQILKENNALDWWYTRKDVKDWMTVANYLKLSYSQNGQTVTKDLTNEYLYFGGIYTGDNRYKVALEQNVDREDLNTVYWWDDWLDHNNRDIYLPTTELKPGTNTLSFSGKVRVFFNAGYHTDAVNSKSVSIQFLVTGLPKPAVQAKVEPADTKIAYYNGQYYLDGEVLNPATLDEKVGAIASVDTSQLFPGVKIKLWEFKVYKKQYDPVQGTYVPVEVKDFTIDTANGPNITFSDDKGTCTFAPASDMAVFTENIKNVRVGTTYTPAYYVDVRYQTEDGRWSEWASTYTQAKITVTEPLAITKTVDPANIAIGDVATYTITVKNLIDKPLPNVRVYDSLTFSTTSGKPTTMAVVKVLSHSGNYTPTDAWSGIWNIGTINGGEEVTLTMEVKGNITGQAINTATIMGTSQKATAVLTVWTPDKLYNLSIKKTVDKTDIYIGQTATFKIEVTNNGLADVKNVVVKDILLPPPNAQNTLEILNTATTHGTFDKNQMVWYAGEIDVGETATLIITVKALPFEPGYEADSKVFDNVAEIEEPVEQMKTAMTQLTVWKPKPDVRITKTVDPAQVEVGQTAVFTVKVTNIAPVVQGVDTTAKNVVIVDQLTQTLQNSSKGLTIVNYSASKGSAYITTTGGTWTVGDLAPGESETLKITVRVDGEGTFTNTAYYQADPSRRDSATLVSTSSPEGNLTVVYVSITDMNGNPVNTIDKTMQVRVTANFSSLFNIPGTVTMRLFINGILRSAVTKSITAFDNWQTDFGYFWVYGASLISVTINYNQPYYMGDDRGTDSQGNVNPWIEKFNGKLETHYFDNVLTKNIPGKNDVISPDGGLYVNFTYNGYDYDSQNNIWRAKVGDAISVTNLSYDTNYTYNYVGRNWYEYDTAISPPPSYTFVGYYEYATPIGLEYAKYQDTFEWWLPDPYGGGPYKGVTPPPFTTIKLTQSYSSKPTGEVVTAYHHEWDIVSRTYDRDVWVDYGHWKDQGYWKYIYDDEGNIIGQYWVSNWVWIPNWQMVYSPITSPAYNGVKAAPVTHYPYYNLITFSNYVPKRYSDDKWQLESAPSYDMYILLTAYDYYTGWAPYPGGYQVVETMNWANQVEHFAYAYKPLRVYYNNKPVAYFAVIGAVNAIQDSNNPIRIQDLSYDPDNDPIVAYEWEVDGQKFSDTASLENYLNTVVKLRPGWHVITLRVKDDPTKRYYRLEPEWSEVFQRSIYIQGPTERWVVSYKARLEFDRDVVYTMYHKSDPKYAIDSEQHSYVKVHVKVWDIGYWTYHYGVNGDKILEFKPLKVTNAPQPYTRLVRYKNAGVLTITPVRFENIKINNNSFEYDAYFMYPKAGKYNLDERTDSTTMGIPPTTQDSKMVFPFEVEKFGLVETLIKDHFAVNAFNPTFADPPGEDRTKFYSIAGLDDGNLNHLDLGVKITDHSIYKDGRNQYIIPDPAMAPQPWIGYKKERISDELALEIDRQIYPY